MGKGKKSANRMNLKDASRKAVCIIGMHRSGTSMVARLLSLCGLDFGPQHQLLPANFANSMGYYENNIITYQINEPLLNHLGGSWDKPPILSPGWETDSSLDEFYREAQLLIDSHSKSILWGWKDPRTTLLLPFWKSLVPDLRFVICVRNPLDVASSLTSRDNLSASAGIDLWTLYMEIALRDTQGCPRIFSFYEDYFESTNEDFDTLIKFCGLHKPRGLSISDNFIYSNLRHHVSDIEKLARSDDVPTEALLLYMKLRYQMSENSPDKMLSHNFEVVAQEAVDQSISSLKPVMGRNDNDIRKFVLDMLAKSKRNNENDEGEAFKKHVVDGENINIKKIVAQRPVHPQHTMVFPVYDKPLVSIIIPTFNKVDFLFSCLRTVLYYTNIPYELIIVDDASNDETHLLLDKLENVQIVRNEINIDFLRSTNKGADIAEGRYILFLNNDVTVRKNWLKGLVDTIKSYPDCGAVGARIIGMDGLLQEAGTIILYDGDVLPYGVADDAFMPEYSYLREVDFCSAACLLVRADLFRELGGFDERYIPAYYEDPDLCLGIQQLGYKIVYQPDVTIFHHKIGSRPLEQATALHHANQPKFAQKWASNLARRNTICETLMARDLRQGKRVLVLVKNVSLVSATSVFDSIHILLNKLVGLKYIVTIFLLGDWRQNPSITHDLQQSGIEVFYDSAMKPEKFLQIRSGYYDIIVFNSQIKETDLLDHVDNYFPDADILEETESPLRLLMETGSPPDENSTESTA